MQLYAIMWSFTVACFNVLHFCPSDHTVMWCDVVSVSFSCDSSHPKQLPDSSWCFISVQMTQFLWLFMIRNKKKIAYPITSLSSSLIVSSEDSLIAWICAYREETRAWDRTIDPGGVRRQLCHALSLQSLSTSQGWRNDI